MRLDDDEIPDAESEDDSGEGDDEEPGDDEESGDDAESGDDEEPGDAEDSGDDAESGDDEEPGDAEDSGDEAEPGDDEEPGDAEDSGDDEEPVEEGYEALVRHLTRLQISRGADPGMWSHPDMGVRELFEGEDDPVGGEEGGEGRLEPIPVPPGSSPMVIADAREWAVEQGLLGRDEEPTAEQLFDWLGPMNNY